MTPKCRISAGRKTPSLQEPRNEELFLLFMTYLFHYFSGSVVAGVILLSLALFVFSGWFGRWW
jgi:hypothetical protein